MNTLLYFVAENNFKLMLTKKLNGPKKLNSTQIQSIRVNNHFVPEKIFSITYKPRI